MGKKTPEESSVNIFSNYSEIKTERAVAWEKSRSKEYKAYRKRWVEYPKKLKIPDFPMHMDFELSSFCNLKCPFCARTMRVEKGIWRENKNMEFEMFKKVIDEGAKEGLCAINLNNYGEPTINPKLVDMVKYAKSKGILDVFFHTNGVLLNKELSRKLIEAGLDRIIISVDTPYKEKYEKQRVGARYENVIQNIKDLFSQRKKMNSLTPLIRINMIKFPDLTEKELKDMQDKFLKMSDAIGFLELDDNDLDKERKAQFPVGSRSKFICPQLITRLTVLEYGAVCPCCIDIDATLKLGDANTDQIKDLWNSKKLKELRRIHFEGKFYTIPTCRNCDWALKEDKKLRNIKVST